MPKKEIERPKGEKPYGAYEEMLKEKATPKVEKPKAKPESK